MLFRPVLCVYIVKGARKPKKFHGIPFLRSNEEVSNEKSLSSDVRYLFCAVHWRFAADLSDFRYSVIGSACSICLSDQVHRFAFGLPLVAFGFFAHNFHLRHLLEQKDQKIREFQEKVLEHQAFARNNSNARYSQEFKNSLNYLFCAFAEDTKLTEQERKELIKFIDEL